MTYKDLNVYQRGYKVAIKLHTLIENGDLSITPEELNQLRQSSREIIANIAEGFSQRTAKAKRFFNYKAIKTIHNIIMDLDFIHDTERLSDEQYQDLYNEYDICARQLYVFNKSIIENKEKQAVSA